MRTTLNAAVAITYFRFPACPGAPVTGSPRLHRTVNLLLTRCPVRDRRSRRPLLLSQADTGQDSGYSGGPQGIPARHKTA